VWRSTGSGTDRNWSQRAPPYAWGGIGSRTARGACLVKPVSRTASVACCDSRGGLVLHCEAAASQTLQHPTPVGSALQVNCAPPGLAAGRRADGSPRPQRSERLGGALPAAQVNQLSGRAPQRPLARSCECRQKHQRSRGLRTPIQQQCCSRDLVAESCEAALHPQVNRIRR
jgi:hypothetical protein